jgi:hypothetical protein
MTHIEFQVLDHSSRGENWAGVSARRPGGPVSYGRAPTVRTHKIKRGAQLSPQDRTQ